MRDILGQLPALRSSSQRRRTNSAAIVAAHVGSRLRGAFSFIALLLLTSGVAHATVLVPVDLGELSRDARTIARGRVVAVDGRWTSDRRTIETIVTPQSDRVTVEVIDNGIGLPKQNRNRLLEPYVTTKGHKGTGLGLAMVQKITEQHGGTLTLEDAPKAPGRQHGALVRITLPLETMRGVVLPEPSASPTQQAPA